MSQLQFSGDQKHMSVEGRNDTLTQLKILFVIDSLGTGGAELDLAEKLPHLRYLGVVIVVVSLRHRQEGVQAALQGQGFDVRILPVSGLIRRIAALRQIIRTEQPDLIQTVLFHADIAGRLAAIGTSAKVISRLVNTDYGMVRLQDPNINILRFRLARLIDGWTARHLTHHIYANSNAVRTAAMSDLGIPAEKITVIKEVRDAARLGKPSIQRRNLARSKLGLEGDQNVLVTIGRQDFQKGQRYLLEAMAMLVSNHPHLVLLVAGRSGDVSGELESLRHRLGLKDRVHFLGHREDVPEILAAADLFVFPSFYEGLPGAVIEAMALGLPIVASDIEPVRETVEVGRNAILVKPASPVELASAIEDILKDRQTAQAFGARSREIYEKRFTLEQSMGRLMEFYRQVVSLN
jgi:glycosyltransferase involved in cell wall biosynthesis